MTRGEKMDAQNVCSECKRTYSETIPSIPSTHIIPSLFQLIDQLTRIANRSEQNEKLKVNLLTLTAVFIAYSHRLGKDETV